MTRRRLFARRPLNLQGYIHRATVGLPKAERLDAAAELRTHLVEQIDKLRAAGHPADEAEYLAVQAMGDPASTNRSLLGHAFTHKAGWAVLAAVLLGGGGWAGHGYVQREWMPPREGVLYTGNELTIDDLRALTTDQYAPRGTYQTATLIYPKGTRSIFYMLVTPYHVTIQKKNLLEEINNNLFSNNMRQMPGSYRYQERWLLTEMRSDTVCPGHWEPYFNISVIPTAFIPLHSSTMIGLTDLPWTESTKDSVYTGVLRQFHKSTTEYPNPRKDSQGKNLPNSKFTHRYELFPPTPGSTAILDSPMPLKFNHWAILRQLVLNPRTAANGLPTLKGTAAGMYIAVMPSSQAIVENEYSESGKSDAHGNVTLLGYGRTPLPPAPQLNTAQTEFVTK